MYYCKVAMAFITLLLFAGLAIPSQAQTTWYVDDDAPNDPGPGDPDISDPLEDGTADHPFDAIQVSPDGKILKCDLCDGDPVCVKYCPPRPEHSLPHLPWPAQSCLQYSESHSAGKMNNRKKSEE